MRSSLLLLLAASCAGPSHLAADRRTAAASRAQAEAAYNRKAYDECAADFAAAARIDGPQRAGDVYSQACCQSLAGMTDAAFARLDESIALGYHDVANIKIDTDLAPLRADPRWADVIGRAETAQRQELAGANPELRALYEADQAARTMPYDSIDWTVVGPADKAREQRVDAIIAAGGAKVSADYYHAAMVFQHAGDVPGILKARELALRAVALDDQNHKARWLAAAALDRSYMYKGEPQKYGTQFKKLDGRWALWAVDPTVSDDQRAEWDCPSLDEARQRAEAMNAAH